MRKQMIVGLGDFRYVSIECPRCHTRLVLDMQKREFANEHNFFTPKICPGCSSNYDSAIQPNVDRLQVAYEGLMEIADRVTFLSEPEDEKGGK